MNLVASLILGLREESRLQQKLQNSKTTLTNYLLAGILDRLSLLVWANTKDAQKGLNKPKMVIDSLFDSTKNQDNISFNSSEDFEQERQRILKGGGNIEWYR